MRRVVSPSIPVPLSFLEVYQTWRKARRGKQPSMSQMRFEANWIREVSDLARALSCGWWRPRRTACFVVSRPKWREIHAPDFADRVLHHWLVPALEKYFEPRFIADSFANRQGKGAHAAVSRLQGFMRQVVDGAGRGQGWYLQMDVRDCFYSIHRPTLYQEIKRVLQRQVQRNPTLAAHVLALQSLCHKLLAEPPEVYYLPSARRARLPARKRLACAAQQTGLPIGNLSSQFFANVYLDVLDQYVKRTLGVRHYVRYVDDLVLLAPDRASLLCWRNAIEGFARERLRLHFKPSQPIPLGHGVDFLGYRTFTHHRTVRPRVVAHLRERLQCWQRTCVQTVGVPHTERSPGWHIVTDTTQRHSLRASLASFLGHISHTGGWRLRQQLLLQYPWLGLLFEVSAWLRGELKPRWGEPSASCLQQQLSSLRVQYPNAWLAARCGARYWLHAPAVARQAVCALPQAAHGVHVWRDMPPSSWLLWKQTMLRQGMPFIELEQTGVLRHGARRREIKEWFVPQTVCHDLSPQPTEPQ